MVIVQLICAFVFAYAKSRFSNGSVHMETTVTDCHEKMKIKIGRNIKCINSKIIRSKRIGYNVKVMRLHACSVIIVIMVNNSVPLFYCTPVGRASGSMMIATLSTHDFSTLYTTLPHNLIKEKLLDLIERTFYKKEGKLYLACNDKKAFFTSADHYKGYHLWSCQNVCDALSFLLDNIYIRFGTELYRQIVGIPMGANCAPLVADLFLFCYERDFMKTLSSDNQADVIKAFNLTSRYLDDLLNNDNPYFEGMVNQIYPPELQLNKANTSETEAPFLDLHLSISNGFVSSKIYDKRDDFDFDIVNNYMEGSGSATIK